MTYLPELDDRRQEIRRAAGQRIVCWPKVSGVGNVFVEQASCSVRMPTGAELAAAACTLTEFGEVDEEVHRLSVDFDASSLALAEGYQVVFVFEYEGTEYQETVRFDVVHEPWAGHDISLNDLRDEVSAVGELLDGLARAKAGSGTSRTAEQEASVFAVKACQQVKGWIRQQLTARGRVYPRLILQREELRQVVAAQAVALIYRSAGGASAGRYADLATQWADEARDRFTSLGEMPYDADEDSVADDVIGGFTSVTLRRGGPRASSFASPTSTPAAMPSLVVGGGGGTVNETTVRSALALSTGAVALNGQAITSVGLVDGVNVSGLEDRVNALEAAPGATGDVVGPASATDNAVARFDSTTGTLIQNSSVTIDDSGNITTSGTVDGVDVSGVPSTVTAVATDLATHAGSLNPHTGSVPTTRTVTAGTGLTGGGDLSANRSLAVDFASTSTAGKVTEANDPRLADSRAPNGSASGDLTGTYPAPTIAALAVTAAKMALATITDAQVAAANKDGAAGTASMRTLGTGAAQAAPGNVLTSLLTANGDLLTRASGNPVRLGIGSSGQSPRVVGGALVFGYPLDPRRESFFYEDFIGAIAGTTLTYSGFSLTSSFTTADRTGIVQHNSVATGQGSISTGTSHLVLGTESFVEWSIRVPELSGGSDTYTLYVGAGDVTSGGDHTDSIGFRYTDSVNSGNWQGVCRSNSVESAVNGSVAATASTWVRLGFYLNTAVSSVEFFVDGVSIGSLTTNIPTASARALGLMFKVDRTAGTNSRLFAADFVTLWKACAR